MKNKLNSIFTKKSSDRGPDGKTWGDRNNVKRIRRDAEKTRVQITLAGVPNVGKSTVFNALTGMNQHTGNWTGKTVDTAVGEFEKGSYSFTLVDIPGTYSLFAHSAEEEVARDFIVSGGSDLTVIVCDATGLERSLTLALQIMEITSDVVLFVNLADEARKKRISIDAGELQNILGVPVILGAARSKKGIGELIDACISVINNKNKDVYVQKYPDDIENAVSEQVQSGAFRHEAASKIYSSPEKYGFADETGVRDAMAESFVAGCDEICRRCVRRGSSARVRGEGALDRLFTGRVTGFPIMALLLILIFWITIKGANYPSSALWKMFCFIGEQLKALLFRLSVPGAVSEFITDGVYRVTTWIISVMLPPMAIFFPMFTLLEDFGYLPRIAFNLDRCFKKCGGCGKQALCMCMGLGCNAVGVTGCRIIDSKRERLIAMFTNCLIPCNGRFPAIITLISIFFVTSVGSSFLSGLVPAVVMALLISLSVAVTFFASFILSRTVLSGTPSSFTLELPPFRIPKIGETIVRSVFDRTLFVLGRALAVAAPAGAVIWLLANIAVRDRSLLWYITSLLEPMGRIMGLDGVILTAFILGLPANEIVLPIIIMAYLAEGTLPETDSLAFVSEILRNNGWTLTTALCTVIFSMFHFPCSTTLLTVKKETGSTKHMIFAALYPTAVGAAICTCINLISKLFCLIFR